MSGPPDYYAMLGIPRDATQEELEFPAFSSIAQNPSRELLRLQLLSPQLPFDAVDLGDVVREQIYLSLPMQSICKESCRGLCPVCGANLNETSCLCRKTESPPAFSKLRLKGE